MSSNALKVLVLILVLLSPGLARATWSVSASASPSSGGTVSPPGLSYYADTAASADFTVTPNPGYSISTVRVGGIAIAKNASGTYTVTKKIGSQTLTAYFSAQTYSVNTSVTSGGAILPAFSSPAPNALQYGKDYTFNINPNAGYQILDVKVDGVSVGPVTSYTFSAIKANHTLWASFGVAAKVVAVALPLSGQTSGLGSEYGVELDGTQSSTTLGTLGYSWAVTATNPPGLTGGGFINPTAAKPIFYATATGDYTITLTVNDGLGHSSSSSIRVTAVTRQVYQSQSCTCCHVTYTPAYVSGYLSSKHSTTPIMPVSCQSCHDPEFYSHYSIQHPINSCTECHATVTPQVLSQHNASPHAGKVSCLGCHNQHAVQVVFTASYCAGCHNATFAANGVHNGLETVLGNSCQRCHSAHLFGSSASRTHFNGYSSYANPAYAAAYVTPRTACADCHKGGAPGSQDDAALDQYRNSWAASGHGSTAATPWKNSSRHDWKSSGTAGSTAATNSATPDCVRCHSAAGFIQYLAGGRVDPMGTSSDHSSEPLACSACHNADFSARNVPAVTAYYNYSSALLGKVLVNRAAPDLKKSNLCLGCHSGRLSGATISALAAKAAQSRFSSSFWSDAPYLDGHYLSAGGQLLGATGYQYPGMSYTNSSIDHSSVAVSAGSGPCVGCHMQDKTHSFVSVNGGVCAGCHRDGMTDQLIAQRQAEFKATLKALELALAQRNFPPVMDAEGNLEYPYFTGRNWGGKENGAGNLGAAFNYSLLSHDPGAYLHNPGYTKRLLRDSIDWLMNGAVDRGRDLNPTIAALLGDSDEQGRAQNFLAGSAHASASCAVCHANDREGTETIVSLYNASKHGKKANGASCANCHAPAAQVEHPTTDPGAPKMLKAGTQMSDNCLPCHKLHSWQSAGICTRCHTGHDLGQVTLSYPHFTSFTTAQFVTRYLNCDNCHTTEDESGVMTFALYSANTQWARTGKGNASSASYVTYDFKTLGTPTAAAQNATGKDCVKCHTTTGYINYVKSSFSDIRPFPASSEPDRTREMVACPACHEPTPFRSYDHYDWDTDTIEPAFQRREVPLVKSFYNFSAAGVARISYAPDTPANAGTSNNCIVCHSGTMAGWTIKRLPLAFLNNTPFIDPHGKGAAGLLYQTTGYMYTHARRTYDAPVFATHRGIGTDSQGPCVGCHMSTSRPHLFSPVSSAGGSIQKITAFDEVCWACHLNSGSTLTPSVMNERKKSLASSLKAMGSVLASKQLYFDAKTAPYFFKSTTGRSAADRYTDWGAFYRSSPATGIAPDLMGAAFNLRLLSGDPGAYAHNDYYAKKLLYDSLDYVDNKKLDYSVYLTIQNLPVTADFTADDKTRALAYIGTRLP